MEERIDNLEKTMDDFTPPFKAVMVKLDQHSLQLNGLRLQINELEGSHYEQSAIQHQHSKDIREMNRKIDTIGADVKQIIVLLSQKATEE